MNTPWQSKVRGLGTENSSIELVRQNANTLMHKWINTTYEVELDFKLELLFRATDVGCHSYTFHKMCDGQGPTVTFVETQDLDKVFGGYTSIAWNSSLLDEAAEGLYVADRHAFLFSLSEETMHPVKPKDVDKAVWHHPDFLAYFGSYDFFLEDGCFKKEQHNQALGYQYQLGEEVEGNWAGLNRTHFSGARDFKVKEVEVYKVVF